MRFGQYWELIADKLSGAGWSWGYCSAITQNGWRWIVDAHKNDGKRYIVQSDEVLSAFLGVGKDFAIAAARSLRFAAIKLDMLLGTGLKV